MIDIPKYDNYKFDLDLNKVYSIKNNIYLKNILNNKGYYQVGLYKNGKGKIYKVHRLVYICNNPTEDISEYQIDHIDNNKTNNKIENLRKATESENCSNRKTHKNNILGIKYIYKTKHNTYRFNLVKNKIKYSKGFKNLQDALEYRDKFVLEKCGEFTRLD